MDNAQKAVIIGVGLFITIIIIAAVMLITGMGQDLLSSGNQEVSNISASLQAQLISDFDRTVISGAQVKAAVKRYYKDETMVIIVNATDSGLADTTKTYNYGKILANGLSGGRAQVGGFVANGTKSYEEGKGPTPIGMLSDTSSAVHYVPNTAKYTANIIKIKGTDTVIGIVFQLKNY